MNESWYREIELELTPEKEHTGVLIGEEKDRGNGEKLEVTTPIDGSLVSYVRLGTPDDLDKAVKAANEAFLQWRLIPAPQRGELVRRIANKVR
ncbi:MAG: aldehyde dehydrogenase family protein, partial [Chroococcales cyanobacterium]